MAKIVTVEDTDIILIKLDNGRLVMPQDGGWYDGRQYYKDELGEPGVSTSYENIYGDTEDKDNG